jgi:hypothetical protein
MVNSGQKRRARLSAALHGFLLAMLPTAILSLSSHVLAADPSAPTLTISVPPRAFVVGEPIAIDFILTNPNTVPVPSKFHDVEDFACQPAEILFYRGKDLILRTGYMRKILTRGQLREAQARPRPLPLRPGERWCCRKFAVPWVKSPADGGDRQAICFPAGAYTLVAETDWPGMDKPLRSDPVDFQIVSPSTPDDQGAAALLDGDYVSLLCQEPMRAGFDDCQPTGSVKEIIERYPSSVHAARARCRLLQIRSEELCVGPGERAAAMEELALSAIAEIDAHLAADPDDPLAPGLLWRKFHLLGRLEDLPQMRATLDELERIQPDSGYRAKGEQIIREASSDPDR